MNLSSRWDTLTTDWATGTQWWGQEGGTYWCHSSGAFLIFSKTRYDGHRKMDWLPRKRYLPIIIDDQSSGSIWLFLMIDYEISAENIPQNSQASRPD